MFVIDQLAIEQTDPLIISHWDVFNSPQQSCVRINIVTQVSGKISDLKKKKLEYFFMNLHTLPVDYVTNLILIVPGLFVVYLYTT